jgi:predicted ATPase
VMKWRQLSSSVYRALRLLADCGLASLIRSVAVNTQVLVVTHSRKFTEELAEDGVQLELINDDTGETRIAGQGLLDIPSWQWGSR